MAKKRTPSRPTTPEAGVVEIKNAGPVQGIFRVDVSRGPGLYWLSGPKGSGKSTVLAALQRLQGHEVPISVTDGHLDGYVRGFGVHVPLGPRAKPTGDLEVETLGGDFTFGDFLSPQGKTAVTRDRQCIQALVSLTGVQADVEQYHELVGGREAFDQLGISKPSSDPVALAGQVKRALEAKARVLEAQADTELGHVEEIGVQVRGVDLSAESDLAVLMGNRDQAKARLDALREKVDAADIRDEEIKAARESLAKAKEGGDPGERLQEAEDRVLEVEKLLESRRAIVADLERQLADARQQALDAERQLTSAKLIRDERVHNANMAKQWEATIAQPLARPSDQALESAQQAVEAAEAAYQTGVRVRDAKAARERVAQHQAKADELSAQAQRYRAAAANTFEILTRNLQTTKIKVEMVDDEARLVVQHPTRGQRFFNGDTDLSEGERIMFAIEELLPRVPKPGLFEVPQEYFQAIQPSDRAELHRFAVERGIFLWGAIVTDEPMDVHYGWNV